MRARHCSPNFEQEETDVRSQQESVDTHSDASKDTSGCDGGGGGGVHGDEGGGKSWLALAWTLQIESKPMSPDLRIEVTSNEHPRKKRNSFHLYGIAT